MVVEKDEIVGIVTQKDIVKNAKTSSLLLKDVMQKSFKTVDAFTELTKVLELIAKEKNSFLPVTEKGKLIGAIDSVNISEFLILKGSGR